ncbi:MAG: hypothetical protein LBH01_01875 [Verrucomicrobiales bacterium]|jgi:hypothetical protein|nr:hypothetical protein [Verrucomicrobiales bacterium]
MSKASFEKCTQGHIRFPSYMPRTEDEFLSWSANFLLNLETNRDLLDVNPVLLQQLNATHANLKKSLHIIGLMTRDLASFSAYKNRVLYALGNRPITGPVLPAFPLPDDQSRTGFVKTIKTEIARIKAHPDYSTVIGLAMGIESLDHPSRRKSELTPSFKLLVDDFRVILHWKKGPAEALRILADHGDGELRLAGVATRAKFTDPAPLPTTPAIWRYQVCYLKRDRQIGFYSPIKEIAVKSAGVK